MLLLEDEDDALEVLRKAYSQTLQKESFQQEKKDNPKLTLKTEQTLTIETTEKEEEKRKVPLRQMEWEANMQRFKGFLDVVKGKVDIRSRLDAILNPDNPQTSSRLSESEIDFVMDAYWLAKTFPVFKPLKDLADELLLTKISQQGLGRQEAIQFMSAMETSKMIETILGVPEKEKPKSRLAKLFKKETETE